MCAFHNILVTFYKLVNIVVYVFRLMKKYFDKVVEWDKKLIKKFQDKFNLTDYQVTCISFAKGLVIGAIFL